MQPIQDVPFTLDHLRDAYRDAHLHPPGTPDDPHDPAFWGARALEAFQELVPDLDPGVESVARQVTALLATPTSPFAGMCEATPTVAEMYQSHSAALKDADDALRTALVAVREDALRRHFHVTDWDGVSRTVEVTWDDLTGYAGPLPVAQVAGLEVPFP